MEYIEMENCMARYMHLCQQSQTEQGRYCKDMELSVWTSPAYRLSEDKKTGNMSCDTYTYRFYRNGEGDFCEVSQKRAEAVFSENECGITMDKIQWYTIQAMKPWLYAEPADFDNLPEYPGLPEKHRMRVQDYLEIRNLQNIFFEHRFHQCGQLFADRPGTSLYIEAMSEQVIEGKDAILEKMQRWLEQEKKNHHCYVFLGITSTPVIEVDDDGQSAEGLFTIEIFQTDARSEDKEKWLLKRQIGLVQTTFVKINKSWKIYRMYINKLMPLPDVQYRNDIRYDKMGQSNEPWEVDQGNENHVTTEAAYAAENIINRWVYGCRRGELPRFVAQYIVNPDNDHYMMIRSYGAKTKALENLNAIIDKTNTMTSLYCNRYYTYHAPTTPVIQVNSDGTCARGTWYDHAATNLRSMAKTQESIPYMVFVNKYVHDFKKINGRWYMTRFYAEPLIAVPDWELDMVHSRGYISVRETEAFPEVFTMEADKNEVQD